MPRIVDSVLVHDDGPNQSTEFDQCVPVATVACEPRRLDCEHATDAAFTDPRQQALEARPVAAATRATQIIVDELDSGPAELPGAIGEPVLTVPALLVVQELIGCRLTDIDARASGQMLSRDLGHWRCPPLPVLSQSRAASPPPASPDRPAVRLPARSVACSRRTSSVGNFRIRASLLAIPVFDSDRRKPKSASISARRDRRIWRENWAPH